MKIMSQTTILGIAIPLVLITTQVLIEIFLSSALLQKMHSEKGIHEIFQALITLSSFLIGLFILTSRKIRTFGPYVFTWVFLATICCLYVTGEETSWGQHLFDWSTPENWSDINDQNETNIHNTSSWFDQKPRLLLELGVVVGGIVVPLLLRYKPHILPAKFSIIYPTFAFTLTAVIFASLKLFDQIEEILGAHHMTRGSEVQEIFLFYFVALYMLLLKKRICDTPRTV